jgi:uncharacterized protein
MGGWATAMGGRYLDAPTQVHGRDWPSSGTFRATYTARVVAPDHPVCAGVDDFELSDELYCCPVFTEGVTPLLRTDAPLDGHLFTSTYETVLRGPDAVGDCSAHPPASDLLAWAKPAGRSPAVYIQPGDWAPTFRNAAFRRLLGNAVAWVASPDARAWAAEQGSPLPDG